MARLPFKQMESAYTIAIITILGSGVSAGAVTFWMNFWRAELEFRRAKIEELYAAVYRYTLEMQIMSAKVRTGKAIVDGRSRVWATEDYDRISLLIDLYFPRLRPKFSQFISAIEDFVVQDGKFRTDDKGFSEDLLRINNIAEKLKQEVVALSRQGGLRALIEAVQDYDQDHS
jgi:hypothetical protein